MNPMTGRLLSAFIPALLGVIAACSTDSAQAQLMVQMKLQKTHYLAYEPMRATVTINNRSGHDIVLGGPKGRSWLTLDVYRDGQLLSPRPSGSARFSPVLLASGKSIIKTVDVAQIYPVTDYGSYSISAAAYFPPLKKYFSSPKQRANVTDSRAFWKQAVGVSQGRYKLASFREFSLHKHHDSGNSTIYVRLREVKGTRVYCTFSLGRYINVRKPQATVDSQNRLHVMHMISPRIYSHAQVSPEGTFLGNKYYREVANNRPTLTIDTDGSVKVAGGVLYDPEKTKATAYRAHSAAELPPGLAPR